MVAILGATRNIWVVARATRLAHRLVVFAHDTVMAAASFALSVYLRLGDGVWDRLFGPLLLAWILFTAVCAVVFWLSQIPRGMWRYTSMNDMIVIARAVTLALLLFLLVTFIVTRLEDVPRSTLIINWMVLAVLMSAPRLLCRLYRDGRLRNGPRNRRSAQQTPALLIGTGDSAELFIREMARHSASPYHILGIIDEGGGDIGLNIHGLPIMGELDDLPAVIDHFVARGERPQHIILTRPLQRSMMQKVMDVVEDTGIPVARLPRLTELKKGAGEEIRLQPIAVEDLLGRTQAKLNHASKERQFAGQRVMVTGAGGSIGSELARQVAALSPEHLTLLDASETLLYAINLEIGEHFPDLSKSAILADVRDRTKMDQVMAADQPSLVFHAAALKHVPLVEMNKIEGVLTNTIGTRNVADACRRARVKAMVLISTDKAVNPTSTMGAAKRLGEQYCQALNGDLNNALSLDISAEEECADRQCPRFITVRFGNVLGSSGSVIPLFKRQLAAGGPLTVTHPDMHRYFMTANEAVELVLQAMVMGLEQPENDSSSIYVLDMGKPIKIMDLANQMIHLAGLRPGEDVEVKITGMRPGEKLSEELFHDFELLKPTVHPSLHLAFPRHADLEVVQGYMDALTEACLQHQEDKVVWYLQKFVPEYHVDISDERQVG